MLLALCLFSITDKRAQIFHFKLKGKFCINSRKQYFKNFDFGVQKQRAIDIPVFHSSTLETSLDLSFYAASWSETGAWLLLLNGISIATFNFI